jgi:hypothetical protein
MEAYFYILTPIILFGICGCLAGIERALSRIAAQLEAKEK